VIPPRYAELASKVLARESREFDAPLPPVAINDRARAIGAIEAALAAKARRKLRLRFAIGGACAAAAAALLTVGAIATQRDSARVAGTSSPASSIAEGSSPAPVVVGQSGDVRVVSPAGASSAPSAGAALAHGSHLVARHGGHAILAFATGTRLTVDDGGDVAVDDAAAQIFSLSAGSVRADVAKLSPGQRFVVRTPDAEVEAHGTSFRVALAPSAAACGDGTVTRVVVYEGVVVVRRGAIESRVASGEEWPRGCVAPLTANAPSSPIANAPAVAVAAESDDKPNAAPPSARTPDNEASGPGGSSGSSLAKQNDLFAQAVAQKRAGRAASAVATFDRLLATYPSSPLAEAALAERMKLLASIDRGRGESAAKQYLARYPSGFARADAEAIRAGTR
jgi:ferric-dicitrate binding protein FerR (iron transport regulator)